MQSLPFFIVSLCRLRFRYSICAPAMPGRHLRTNAGRGKADGTIFAATDAIRNRNAMERIVEFPTDRTVISTENNGFAGDGTRTKP